MLFTITIVCHSINTPYLCLRRYSVSETVEVDEEDETIHSKRTATGGYNGQTGRRGDFQLGRKPITKIFCW